MSLLGVSLQLSLRPKKVEKAMSINYLDIIKKSWATTWKNKHLWWFGFFVSLTSGSSFFPSSNSDSNQQDTFTKEKIISFVEQHLTIIIYIAIALTILFIIFSILGLIGRGALIKSINELSKGELFNFKSGLSAGKKYFWKILGLGFFLGLFIFAVLIIIILPITFLFASHSYILGSILSLAGIIIFIPLIVLVSFLKTYGQLYIILGDLDIRSAIESSYNLFRKNLNASLVMCLVFILIGIIFSLSVLVALIPMAVIFSLLGFTLSLIFKTLSLKIIIGLGVAISVILLVFLNSIYETFSQAVWVFFFHEIAKPKITEIAAETVVGKISDPVATPDPITFSEK